ncbi:putative small heat shock protein HSP20 [Dioscorea sansibarensis]
MEFSYPFPWPLYYYVSYSLPSNHVHWSQTPESHLFSADLPGVRREEIRVEVEDSRYLIIRTELFSNEDTSRGFMRKFRLPQMIDVDGISAGYADGVLTVTVPRSSLRGRLASHASIIVEAHDSAARAA